MVLIAHIGMTSVVSDVYVFLIIHVGEAEAERQKCPKSTA